MDEAMEQSSPRHTAAADARPKRDVDEIGQPRSGTPHALTKGSTIYVRIKSNWYITQNPADWSDQVCV
jgi:hypothetical protein